MIKLLLRYNLLWVMLAFLFVPGLLTLASLIWKTNWLPEQLSPNYQLVGFTKDPERVRFNLKTLKSHSFQTYADTSLTNKLPFRSFLIRLNNSLYYHLFHKSYSSNAQIIIGKSNQILGEDYIRGYCSFEHTQTQMKEWANKVKRLSNFFEARGQTFIYLITPSKPEYMPEAIPDRFHCKNRDQLEIAHELYLAQLLQKNNVRTINEVTNMNNATQEFHAPMFAKGGTHWNELGAMVGVNSIIETINQAKKIHIDPIKFSFTMTRQPIGRDTDVIDLLNLLNPKKNYPVPKVSYLSSNNVNPKYSIVFIGGSFIDGMSDIFLLKHTFKSMLTFNYFNGAIYNYNSGVMQVTPKPDITSEVVLAPILNADIVVLEENSSITSSAHGDLFYQTIANYAKTHNMQL